MVKYDELEGNEHLRVAEEAGASNAATRASASTTVQEACARHAAGRAYASTTAQKACQGKRWVEHLRAQPPKSLCKQCIGK
jgi:hypothetical protein